MTDRIRKGAFDAVSAFDTLPDAAFVRIAVARAILGGLSATTFYRWVNEGRITRPVKLAERAAAVRVGDLRADLARLGRGARNERAARRC